ncbi:MAG: MgtC/SapB family protein [Candidatus Paceibacterota bacterium]
MFGYQMMLQLILATLLGAILGLERELKEKEAGLQTYSLIALGSCLFTILAFNYFDILSGHAGLDFDPVRIIQSIAIGIGFVGGGAVFKGKSYIEGLTTAAGLWVAAGIGIAVGTEFYVLAVFTAFVALLILSGLGAVEEKFFRHSV